jgi:peptide/nickel transport system substrate-binding protein
MDHKGTTTEQKSSGQPRAPAFTRRALLKITAGVAAATVGFPAVVQAQSRIVIAYGASQEVLDPHQHYHTITDSVLGSVYEPLTLRRADMQGLAPALAESWQPVDERTWHFKIRQGVKFHNGELVDAETVKFSVERLLNPPAEARPQSKGLAPTYITIDQLEVVDAHTVQIKTKVPDPYLDKKFSGFGGNIVPRQYLQDKGYLALTTAPVGTGPYKFVSWVKDGDLVLEANAHYWRGAPKITQVIIRPIPEGATRAAALKAGEVDIVQNLPPAEADTLKKSGRAAAVSVPSLRVMFVQFDCLKGPTQDKRVRQALNYAVNVEELIQFVLGGNGIRIADLLNPFIFGYDSTLTPYPYDPEKAKQLLAEAGYAKGLEVEFDCSKGRYLQDKEMAEAMAGQLAKVGVKARVVAHEWGLYVSKMTAYQLGALSLWGWGNWALDADNSLWPRLRTALNFPKVTSTEAYSNPELDKLLDEARGILDQERRLHLYRQAQRLIVEDAPYIFLYQLKDLYGVSTRIKWQPRPDEMIWPYEASLA